MLRESYSQMKDAETEGRKGEKKEKGNARHGGMVMTAVVWLQGSLSDAKAVSGNTFICPHFLLLSLWIPHPSVALFLYLFFFLFSVCLPRDLYHREICGPTVHLACLKR